MAEDGILKARQVTHVTLVSLDWIAIVSCGYPILLQLTVGNVENGDIRAEDTDEC